MKHIKFSKILIQVLIILLISACSTGGSGSKQKQLELLNSFKIKVPEPSGLSFGANNMELFTVSDKTNKIYKMTLKGEVLSEIECDATDLEGIAYNNVDTSIWIAEERNRRLIQLNLKGETLKSIKLDIEANKKNSGIEGLSINHNNGNIFCVNEKNPGLLIKLNKDCNILETHKLDFAKDYSGVYHDAYNDKLWIISDKSMTITRFDNKGKIEHQYQTDIESMEGIVVDSKNKLIYIVSDELERLFIFNY